MSQNLDVICFAPYAVWATKMAPQIDLLRDLGHRSYRTLAITCDGVFSDCDLHRQVRADNACRLCQAATAGQMMQWKISYRWLGRWLEPGDGAAAVAWISRLSPANYATATHRDWPLGTWMRASVEAHLSQMDLDVDHPATAVAYASHLNSGFLAATALDRLYRGERPRLVLTLNAQMGVLRVAAEVARLLEIATIDSDVADAAAKIDLLLA